MKRITLDHQIDRPHWDTVWMDLAISIGRRSRCHRGSIGCVLVSSDNRVVSVSYVGPPARFRPAEELRFGVTDCRSWCPRSTAETLDPGYADCVSSHAEANAVARADFGLLRGGTAYVNGAVCLACAKLLAAAQVGRVVMIVDLSTDAHRDPDRSVRHLKSSMIEVTVIAPA